MGESKRQQVTASASAGLKSISTDSGVNRRLLCVTFGECTIWSMKKITIFLVIALTIAVRGGIEASTLKAAGANTIAVGDLNHDGLIDGTDVSSLLEIILSRSNPTPVQLFAGDLTGNGVIDEADIYPLIATVLSGENPTGKPLRILTIGNSFSFDCTNMLPTLQYGAKDKIREEDCCLYLAGYSGATFKECLYYLKNNFISGDRWNHPGQTRTTSAIRRFGLLAMPDTNPYNDYGYFNCGLADIVGHDWDIIVIQEFYVQKYSWLDKDAFLEYINLLRQKCTNKNVIIAWCQPWSRTPDEIDPSFTNIADYTEKLWAEFSTQAAGKPCIDIIIPTGTAIQNARNVFCNKDSELYIPNNTYMTRDNLHLGYGIATYIAACSWWDTLIYPWCWLGCLGNPQLELEATHEVTLREMYSLYNGSYWVWGDAYGTIYKDNSGHVAGYEPFAAAMGLVEGPSYNASGKLTDEGNLTTLQMCAVAAIAHPNEVTPVKVSFDEAKHYYEQWAKAKGNK